MTKLCPFFDLEFSECSYSRALAPPCGALVIFYFCFPFQWVQLLERRISSCSGKFFQKEKKIESWKMVKKKKYIDESIQLNSLTSKKQMTKLPSANFQKKCQVQAISYWELKDSRANSVDLDEVAHYEPPHQNLRCLQIQLFSSLVLKELKHCRIGWTHLCKIDRWMNEVGFDGPFNNNPVILGYWGND